MPNAQGRLYPHERIRIDRNRAIAVAKRKAILEKKFWDWTRVRWNKLKATNKRKAIIAAKIEANRQAAIKKRKDILDSPEKLELFKLYLRQNENLRKGFTPENYYPWISRKRAYWNLRFNAGYWRNEARKTLYEHKPWSKLEYKYCMDTAEMDDWMAEQIAKKYYVFKRK